jgi:hypothetical protein
MNKDTSNGLTLTNVLGHKDLDWFAWENLRCTDCGGSYWLVRGGAGDGSGDLYSDNWRFKGITYQHDGGDGAEEPSIWDTWGAVNGMEVLDSVWNCHPEKFNPGTPPSCVGAAVHACMKDIDVINNEFTDFRIGFFGEVDDAATVNVCAALNRPLDYVNIERNSFVVLQSSLFGKGIFGVQIFAGAKCGGSGEPACTPARQLETIRNLTIRGNFFAANGKGFRSAINLDGAHESTCPGGNQNGAWKVLTNTIVSSQIDNGSPSYALLYIGRKDTMDCGPASFEVYDNVLATLDTTDKIVDVDTTSHVSSWSANYNAYSDATKFQWKTNAVTSSLATWRTQSAGDQNGKQCTPVWHETGSTALPTTDGHLASADTCAIDSGHAITDVPIDIDAEPRGAAPDIGYDEYVAP